jgi:hypothetical protein
LFRKGLYAEVTVKVKCEKIEEITNILQQDDRIATKVTKVSHEKVLCHMRIKSEDEITNIGDEIKKKCEVLEAIVLKRYARMLQEKQKEIRQKVIPPVAGYASGFIALTTENLVSGTLTIDSTLLNLLYSLLTALGTWFTALSFRN